MIRKLLVVPLLAMLLAVGCVFDTSIQSDGDLEVDFTMPVHDNIAYDLHLSADGSATYFCLTTNVGTVTVDAEDANASSQDGTFTGVDNQIAGTLSQPVPPPNSSWVSDCIFSLTVQVTWTNITILNETTGKITKIKDISNAP